MDAPLAFTFDEDARGEGLEGVAVAEELGVATTGVIAAAMAGDRGNNGVGGRTVYVVGGG